MSIWTKSNKQLKTVQRIIESMVVISVDILTRKRKHLAEDVEHLRPIMFCQNPINRLKWRNRNYLNLTDARVPMFDGGLVRRKQIDYALSAITIIRLSSTKTMNRRRHK